MELRASARDLFDIAIDQLITMERFSAPAPFDDEADVMDWTALDEDDYSLMELVFLCDARAQVDHDDYSIVTAISWTEFAREGIKRVAQHMPEKKGLERSRLFSVNGMSGQAEAYDDMVSLRKVVKGSDEINSAGLDYALRVAAGDIVLDRTLAV